jgi:hypothetical protein
VHCGVKSTKKAYATGDLIGVLAQDHWCVKAAHDTRLHASIIQRSERTMKPSVNGSAA